ncbi:MAG: transcription termination/antitermination NusG family protein [Opitutales bacterium]|jgi:transcriptional antiterminator RfaH
MSHSPPIVASQDWFCVRSKPRSEKLATFHLDKLDGVEVFFPHVRRVRKSRSSTESTQPLFPGYLFAQFDPRQNLRAVHYCQGVSYVVKCQQKPVRVPNVVMVELKKVAMEGILEVVDLPHQVGDEVRIVSGLFRGGEGKIVKLAPARERIKVLFEILGRETEVEIAEVDVDFPSSNPMTVAS